MSDGLEVLNYRFVISSDGEIIKFASDLQKEIYESYLDVNGLTEKNVFDANQDWEALLPDEQPSPLPLNYQRDIFDELRDIFYDLYCLGIHQWDLEIVLHDAVGVYYLVDGQSLRAVDVMKKLGYEVITEESEGQTFYCVR